MKITLVSFTPLPHHSAESIHIVMTSKSLNEVCNFELISPFKLWRPYTISKNLANYGIEKAKFKIKKFIQFKPNDTSMLNFIFKDKEALYYCRQGIVAKYFLSKNLKVVWEQHALPSETDISFLKHALKNEDFLALVVITESLKTDILKIIGQEYKDRIYILPDGADIDRFHYTKENLRENKILGYIGSDFPGKGYEIIEPLIKKTDNKLEVYGMNGENTRNTTFHGRVPYSEIPHALNSFDIGLLPNQLSVITPDGTDIGKYTSPMKLFEYMAAGKVIIASDIPVIREVLKDNHNALLVPHDDVEAWVDAIDRLNKDSLLFSRLKKQAYQDVCKLYSYEARAKNIIKIIRKNS